LSYMASNSDVWVGWTWWAAGPWWGSYMFSVEPSATGTDNTLFSAISTYLASTGVTSVSPSPGGSPTPGDSPVTPVGSNYIIIVEYDPPLKQGLSSSGKAGVGVGVPLAIILIAVVAIVVILVYRRRKGYSTPDWSRIKTALSLERFTSPRDFSRTYSPQATNTNVTELTEVRVGAQPHPPSKPRPPAQPRPPSQPRPARPTSKPVDEWESITTPDGKVYYHNTTTGETSWDPPGKQEKSTPAKSKGKWTATTTPDGKTYYENESGETTWEKPKDFVEEKKSPKPATKAATKPATAPVKPANPPPQPPAKRPLPPVKATNVPRPNYPPPNPNNK